MQESGRVPASGGLCFGGVDVDVGGSWSARDAGLELGLGELEAESSWSSRDAGLELGLGELAWKCDAVVGPAGCGRWTVFGAPEIESWIM